MARKGAESCMFCDNDPCTCSGTKVKKAPKPRKKVTDVQLPSMPTDDYQHDPVAPRKFKVETPHERDLSYENALRVLYEHVSPRDQRMIERELARPYPQELDRRISEWRINSGLERTLATGSDHRQDANPERAETG